MSSDQEKLMGALHRASKVIICGHSMPDGDSVGSTLAMGMILKELGKSVTMVTPDEVPGMFDFLPSINEITKAEGFSDAFDTAVIVDCTDLNRVEAGLSAMLSEVPVIINIDHHISNQYYGHYNFVNPNAAATGELVFQLARDLGIQVTREMATCLYTAIVMDTGSFRYENTTQNTHRISAELVSAGIDVAGINTKLFENKELKGLRLLGKSLCNLKVTDCGKVAWISIPYELTVELGVRDEHSEGIVNYPRRVRGVLVGLLFREISPNKVKVGFRSKDIIDVNKIAAIFGGGGHPRAAGCQLEMPLRDAEEKVLSAVLSCIEE